MGEFGNEYGSEEKTGKIERKHKVANKVPDYSHEIEKFNPNDEYKSELENFDPNGTYKSELESFDPNGEYKSELDPFDPNDSFNLVNEFKKFNPNPEEGSNTEKFVFRSKSLLKSLRERFTSDKFFGIKMGEWDCEILKKQEENDDDGLL